MPEETKAWWQSKTILSSVAVVALSILTATGVTIPEDVTADLLATQVVSVITAVGGVISIIGRFKAQKKIK